MNRLCRYWVSFSDVDWSTFEFYVHYGLTVGVYIHGESGSGESTCWREKIAPKLLLFTRILLTCFPSDSYFSSYYVFHSNGRIEFSYLGPSKNLPAFSFPLTCFLDWKTSCPWRHCFNVRCWISMSRSDLVLANYLLECRFIISLISWMQVKEK